MTEPRTAVRYRFGVFEADVSTGELRRQGIRVKVNVQPFQVLLLLLERPGEVLTREEISRVLWPEGTFVDYEHGVNSAVNRIREALGDKARNPRFIETLARRGYRFVAPVQRVGDDPIAVAPPPVIVEEQLDEEPEELSPYLAAPHELPKTPWRTVRTLYLLLQLMYVGFYVGALANLAEIGDLFSALSRPAEAMVVLVVTAALLIPVRAFIVCAVLLHAPGVRRKLLKLWAYVLPFDVLWSLAPFLLLHHMNFGLALACTALLVYSPFAQRSLVLMGAGEREPETQG
ncbi:DNA-binding winged helix-turn-helix (wHTH) domain-containing protein [Granulicella rosea]|uniref:DNA-binding winged helix-turn-helix (WHTH) domain-containing protein n=1 Tax=Granulicella rosea TaxID=474952 RepID=A0A239M7G5_9BACT|nr:winged helix-turn-helix domain-containing protein [Granulicella rosea]SNT38063.1 DNA-binding winged helix-turn-helix (wHTH) domain-containing protein [Granulicella rosea]